MNAEVTDVTTEKEITPVAMHSVFAAARERNYPYKYHVELFVPEIHGGTPQNQQVALDHVKRHLANRGELLQEAVMDIMSDQALAGQDPDVAKAAAEVALSKNLNGFRRDEEGMFIEGRHLKACLKEAVSIAVNADKLKMKGWGTTNKWVSKWFPEHVFVTETRLHLGRAEPDGISQRFVVSRHGTGIQLEEFVLDAKIAATLVADFEVNDDDWAAIWTHAEMNGLGASRSQGYGTFAVTAWEKE